MIQLTQEFLQGRTRISKFVCLLTKHDDKHVKWVMRGESNGYIFREWPDYHYGFNGWNTDQVALVRGSLGEEGGYGVYNPVAFAFQSQEEMDLWLQTTPTQ